MVSSARPVFACLVFVLTMSICVRSQTVPEKSASATISGKVTMKGNAVSGVVVGLVLSDNYKDHTTRHKATTGEDGNYRLTDVVPGNYEIVVAAPAYVAARRSLIIGKGDQIENVDFALVRGGVITGKVTDFEGRPIMEVDVAVVPVQMQDNIRLPAGIRTDDRGIYRAFGLRPGKYKVSAGHDEKSTFGDPWSKRDYKLAYHPAAAEPSEATIIEVTEGSESQNVDITLGRSVSKYSASGRIVDGQTGQPVSGIRYGVNMYVSQNYGGTRGGGGVTNKDGEFKLQNLAPGSYAVIAEALPDSDWRVEPLRFQVEDQDVTGLVVKTAKGGSISGVIVLDGIESKPISKANIHRIYANIFLPNRARGSNHVATVNADGSFRLNGLAPGTVGFWFSSPDGLQIVRIERDGVVQPRTIDIKDLEHVSGVRVVADYATGSIRGVVKLASGLLPADARFSVTWKKLTAEPLSWNVNGGAQMDARGHFVAEHLLAGTYEVKAELYVPNKVVNVHPPQFPQATQQVVVTSGNVSNVTLTVPQP